ncbi:MAG: hypothetical protein EI684_04855 [Candidatus Viridilinea halotolerans]|uniref:Uncharacterized protein n=1 Tax=Candidatus Viridilinea halotolerans TaxID=2491704 RepID=A0A426U5V0_9CHLR|nr:MAG: hypothetical protein EI684_04855 [Candidatus Viridilinea halotolerans]
MSPTTSVGATTSVGLGVGIQPAGDHIGDALGGARDAPSRSVRHHQGPAAGGTQHSDFESRIE